MVDVVTNPGDSASEPRVVVEELTKSFGPATALDGAFMRVAAGSVHGLLGPNGAGKTTLLKILLGILHADRGRIEVLGSDPRHAVASAVGGVAGFVDQPRFYPYLSARKNLDLLAAYDGGGAPERVEECLADAGLGEIAHRRVSGFSTGQRQRLGLAAALIRRPVLLIVDEPTTGLDPVAIEDLHRVIRELAVTGASVLLSSHDMAEAEQLCDSVTVLKRGRTLFDGTIAGLREQAPNPVYRVRTSDDDRAVRLLAPLVDIDRASDHLLLHADEAAVDTAVAAVIAGGMSLRELHRADTALGVLFHRLVDDHDYDHAPAPSPGAPSRRPLVEARP